MRQCILCGNYGFFGYGEGDRAVCLCSTCSDNARELFCLARTDKIKYINEKSKFLSIYEGNENAKKVIDLAEDIKNGKSVVGVGQEMPEKKNSVVTVSGFKDEKENGNENTVVSVTVNNASTDDSVFLPFKLLIATLLAVAAFIFPVIGLLFVVIAYRMAEEIPGGFCKDDVKRVKNLVILAVIVNIAVIVIAAISAGVVAWNYF